MEKYLLQVLQEKSRVIIPEFGAIIVKQKHPRKLIFNEFLQYNDGALVNAISKEENIDRDEAARKVNMYVSEIRKKLASGKAIKLKGIGLLTQSATGKIALEDADAIETEDKGATAAQTEKDVNTEDTPVEFDREVQQVDLTETPESEQESGPEIEKKGPVKDNEDKPEQVIPQEEQKKDPRQEPKKEPRQSPVPKIDNKVPPPLKTYNQTKGGGKQNKNILAIIGIVLFNICLVVVVLYFEDIRSFFTKDDKNQVQVEMTDQMETATDVDINTQDEALIIDTAQQEIAADEEKEEVVEQHYYSIKYYVVAGVFSSEGNAVKLMDDLVERGFNAEKFGKIGNLYAVSYDVFPSKKEADEYLKEIKLKEDPEAWIKRID